MDRATEATGKGGGVGVGVLKASSDRTECKPGLADRLAGQMF